MSVLDSANDFVAGSVGITLAVFVGLKATIPLFALAFTAREGVNPWIVGMFMVLEIVLDCIPCLDHAANAVHSVIKPVVAYMVVNEVMDTVGADDIASVLSIVGAALALAVHLVKAWVRIQLSGFSPFSCALETGIVGIGCVLTLEEEGAAIVVVCCLSFFGLCTLKSKFGVMNSEERGEITQSNKLVESVTCCGTCEVSGEGCSLKPLVEVV